MVSKIWENRGKIIHGLGPRLVGEGGWETMKGGGGGGGRGGNQGNY